MKALTIRQPWATLIALGVKHIETRSWRAPQSLIGQTIAIHAGKHKADPDEIGMGPWRPLLDPTRPGMLRSDVAPLPLGAVVATATLADCVPMVGLDGSRDALIADIQAQHLWISDSALKLWQPERPEPPRWVDISNQRPYGDFQPGRWAWMLTDITPCDPIPAKGKQGLWNWEPTTDAGGAVLRVLLAVTVIAATILATIAVT